MTQLTKIALATLSVFAATGANAAAFQLAEISTSGLGSAYAGNAAVADNASVVATNPALMTQFKSTELSAGGILVDGDVHIDGKLGGSFDASHRNIVPNAVVPNAYIVAPMTDRLAIGGGININYGLKSDFNSHYNAGFFGGSTELSAINLNLSSAYKLGRGFSLGVGLNAVYAEAELVRYLGLAGKSAARQAQLGAQQAITAGNQQQAAMLGQAAVRYAGLSNDTIIHKLKGDDWGFGWNAGLLYEINEHNRLGIAYHSAVNLDFKGKYSNEMPLPLNGVVNIATGGIEMDGFLNMKLPAFWEISGYHKLTDKLAAQYSYKRTDWSTFQSLNAFDANKNELFGKTEKFNDSQRIALGLSYDFNEMWTLRTGVAYDESASVVHPSISIPDTDRMWYSVGATVNITPNLSTDIGYSHLRGSKLAFNEENKADFKSKATANLYGVNVNYKF